MAYNLQPLITILQQILDPQQTRWILGSKKPQLESLLRKAASLQQILEKSSLTGMESLESQIRIAAHNAEDVIESYMVERRRSIPRSVRLVFSKVDLSQVMQEFDSAVEKVIKFIKGKTVSTGSSSSSGVSFSHDVQQVTQEFKSLELVEVEVSSKNDLVGVDEDLEQLKDRLTNMQNKLEIIPIVGMGGIGKSALARNLFDDSLIAEHFDYRGWATISQIYNMREILLSLLRGPKGKLSDELIGLNVNELKYKLYQRLFGRRYIIVLDDIWSTEAWVEIGRYFPDNNNGSRILITTRESSVAKDANWSMQHQVQFLDGSKSWDLLRQIVFGKDDCPRVLQEIGEKIARDCDGLPLAIHVIGGLLSKVERSRDAWEHVSSDVKAALVGSNEHFSNILALSYNHLPIHLKPCFLYLGAFPEDHKIKASKLIYRWIAEGFVKSNEDRSLEEEAGDYLKALVERNLLLVSRKKSNGKPFTYVIHDLLRDVCIRKANEEMFMLVKKSPNEVTFSDQRRVSVLYKMEDECASPQLVSLARSFICCDDGILSPIFLVLRLVRVLDVLRVKFEEFPREILELFNLRYLAVSCESDLPTGISRLWNLQTLICEWEYDSWTSDLWEISELRHLRSETLFRIEEGYKMKFVHKKLQTIEHIEITPSVIRSGFLEAIPNIIKLGIYWTDIPCTEVDLSHLHKLQTLQCQSELDKDGSRFLPKLRFPCNLRKLSLVECVIYGSFLTNLCALPNLETLKISECVFESGVADEDEEWEATEGDVFHSLQLLHLGGLNLVRWRADETNFPRLRQLNVYKCKELEEIPSGIGDIPTLELIDIWKCSASVVASAEEIGKVQQEEYDNYHLQVVVHTEE